MGITPLCDESSQGRGLALEQAGGMYILAYSLDDVIKSLEVPQ